MNKCLNNGEIMLRTKYMQYVLSIILMTSSISVYAWEQSSPLPIVQCQAQVPYNLPITSIKGTMICRTGYLTLNDTSAKLPIWVAYVLTPTNAIGCIARSDNYTSDKSIDKGLRADLNDYAKSGYDMGHIAPAGDFEWNDDVQHESFILSNMAPQLPGLNRGIWKLLETSVNGWVVQRNHSYVIYAGPIYNTKDKVIGIDKVIVPHAFYKIVIDSSTNEIAGFLFPHTGKLDNDLVKLRTPIANIEKLTGIKFKYPNKSKELPLAAIWKVNFGALTNLKQDACKIK
jgi:endonuclease G, mitochondrial